MEKRNLMIASRKANTNSNHLLTPPLTPIVSSITFFAVPSLDKVTHFPLPVHFSKFQALRDKSAFESITTIRRLRQGALLALKK